jgi:predicted HTH transcriptional regulator
MSEAIAEAIRQGKLPADCSALLNNLCEQSGKFLSQEGSVWDFKREWPFSYSDDYFRGIARLICAFSNSNGGLIVFGVHDEHRTAGHNRVSPNMDRLQQALRQLLSDEPRLALRRFNEATADAIDVLLVLPNSPTTMPLRFLKDSGNYKGSVIWVR